MQLVRNYFGYWSHVIFINHARISHVIRMCIRVAAAAEEVVYEVVAGYRSNRSGPVPVWAGTKPAQIQNLNLNSKK